MLHLPGALRTWGTTDFPTALNAELRARASDLPLDAAATPGSHVEDGTVTITLLACTEQPDRVCVMVGVFFSETVASCGCGDEPFSQPAYCELRIAIDRATAAATVSVVRE